MASKKVNGIDIAITADTSGVTAGLKEITNESVQAGRNLKTVDSLLKLDPDSVELAAEKQKLLTQNIQQTKEKLEKLKAAQDDVQKAFERGDINEEQYIAFQGEIAKTKNRLNQLENQVDDTGDAMEESEEKSNEFGDSLKSGLSVAATAAAAAVAAVGAAAFGFTKEVVQSFGELEQNLGGSEAVFGEFAETVQKKGEEAYKTLGISQSEYLATANKMGALFQGTGYTIEESMEMSTKAMQRAADMASVMGIDQASALEAVAGAAKGNFTMMDNLGVAINDTTLQLYAQEKGLGDLETTQQKVTAAMQLFMEKTEQYDGNFAREATETISGSFGLLSASWESMIAGFGNSESNIEKLTENVVDAFESVLDNVVPVIGQIVKALPKAIKSMTKAAAGMLPTLLETAKDLFTEVFDTLVSILPTLIPFAVEAILTITDALIDNLPAVVDTAVQLVEQLAFGLADALPKLIPAVVKAVIQIVDTLLDNVDLLIDAAIALIDGLAQGIIDALPILLEKAPEIVEKLVNALVDNAPKLVECAVDLVIALAEALFDNAPLIMESGQKILWALIDGISSLLTKLVETGATIWDKLKEGIGNIKDKAKQWGTDMLMGMIEGITGTISKIKEAASDVAEAISEYLHFSAPDVGPLAQYEKWMPDFMTGLANGIAENRKLVTSAVSGVAEDMADMAVQIPNVSASVNRLTGGTLPAMQMPQEYSGGNIVQNINISVTASIANDMDISRTAERMGQEMQSILSRNNSMRGAWS